MDTEPNLPVAFKDVYEAPEAYRQLNGANLTLDQINDLIKRAYELGEQMEMIPGTKVFQPNIGQAKKEFRLANKIENGQWIPKTPEELNKEENK